jgi:Uma2 family endonuclease
METNDVDSSAMTPFTAEDYRPPIPDTSHLITETDEPVDNIFSEKQMRLLTEPLYASWDPGRPFWVAANVGMYEALNAKAVVPDVLLSLDTTPDQAKEFGSKCYFFWDHGKPPEVVIEIVSNKVGGELDRKKERYAKLHVDQYVVFDPDLRLSSESLQVFDLSQGQYTKRPEATSFAAVEGLGLRLWEGRHEGQKETWLRWIDSDGNLIATGAERAGKEAQRANEEGKRANDEAQRANEEAQRAEKFAARLRELGVDPDSV